MYVYIYIYIYKYANIWLFRTSFSETRLMSDATARDDPAGHSDVISGRNSLPACSKIHRLVTSSKTLIWLCSASQHEDYDKLSTNVRFEVVHSGNCDEYNLCTLVQLWGTQ
jgi:hypothetical protein